MADTGTYALTFIVPVRHPANSRNWDIQVENLMNTARSISAQDGDGWCGVIVANHEAKLPTMPPGVRVERVDFEPNDFHDFAAADRETVMESFRFDKGRRVLAGLRSVPNTRYIMIVDDDDFVSRRLARFVADNAGGPGWYIPTGYGIDYQGSMVIRLDRFHKISGTSHITRADLYDLPPEDDPEFAPYLRKWFGSHGATTEHFERIGAPLEPLPFRGAVYLLNHPNSHSGTNTILRNYIFNKALLKDPLSLPQRLKRLKRLDADLRREFFGEG